MCLGAWLRSGEGIGWLAAGTVPNSLYRVPSYLFLAYALCYCCFLFVVSVFLRKRFSSCFVFILSLKLCRCSSDIFLSSRPRTVLTTTYITGMVEARSVNNVMNTTTTPIAVWCGDTIIVCYYYKVLSNYVLPKYIVLVGFGCGMYYNVFVGFLVSLHGD